jgi:hypothetical protein
MDLTFLSHICAGWQGSYAGGEIFSRLGERKLTDWTSATEGNKCLIFVEALETAFCEAEAKGK